LQLQDLLQNKTTNVRVYPRGRFAGLKTNTCSPSLIYSDN